ncbi:MAG TPA: cell division protein FtsZ [Paludibacteraceae bacterium]|mgnify:FL=1|nr:cell division protein FtsZ [Paludibacteraceae bacterium]HPH62370.1 cell division protein FtsZ [Paludibacteraceae bacterium]
MSESIINIEFDEDKFKPVIKVIGVGGGGGNAVNHMFDQGIRHVDFVICNTDAQALSKSPIPTKIVLGDSVCGAGNKPERGRQAAIKSLPEIEEMLKDSTEMVFITAGMGGGTGTGAAPVIAQAAKDLGILTIGIVTIPFLFEGRRRVSQAIAGVEEMRKHVDAILVINTERIRTLYPDLELHDAFANADNILTMAAKGIAEIITVPGYVNVDLEDVKTVMKNSGDAVMGSAHAAGSDRAKEAIKLALTSPLLLSTNLKGAKDILLNIAYGSEDKVRVEELTDITDYIYEQVGPDAQILWGDTEDPSLGTEINVTIVATGFNLKEEETFDGMNIPPHDQQVAQPQMFQQPIAQTYQQPTNFGYQQPVNGGYQQPINNQNPYQQPQQPFYQPIQPTQQPVDPQKVQQPKEEVVIDVNKYYGGEGPKSWSSKKEEASIQQSPAPQEEEHVMVVNIEDDDTIDLVENVPAYKRKQMQNGNPNNYGNTSNEGEISRFSLGKEGESIQLKDKNDFLHNNVD